MTDPLDDPEYLTFIQRAVAQAGDNLLLTACPGSGKTRTAGARFAVRSDSGLRIAITSYTNVGVLQIRQVITEELKRTVGREHFLGTLHKLLLRYVFYPFGHLVMGCRNAPHLVEDDLDDEKIMLNGDPKLRAPLSKFSFRPDGMLAYRGQPPWGWSRERVAVDAQATALRLKRRAARAGRASSDDAMYWCLQVLHTRPEIARVVSGRFDELLVDEAQDTSALQLACLEALSASGALRSLALVGDVEQSIYSFQGASPEGLQRLVAARKLTVLRLAENHRSSQRICNVTARFRSRPIPDQAVGANAHCPWHPELMLYPPANPAAVLLSYQQRMHDLDVPISRAVVLARKNDVVNDLNGTGQQIDCAEHSLTVGRAVTALRTSTLGRSHLGAVDKIVARTAWGSSVAALDIDQRQQVRQASRKLLEAAPPLDTDLRSWIKGTSAALREALTGIVDVPHRPPGHVLRSAAGQEAITAAAAFTSTSSVLTARSVHNLKGESCDSVLIVADHRIPRNRQSEAQLWASPLMGRTVDIVDAEEIRILYVALTRARRYCAIALPDHTAAEVIHAFHAAGFVPARKLDARPGDESTMRS